MKLGKWKLLLPLALLAVGATIGASGALAKSAQSSDVKVAIMTDCKGAFAFGYEVDTAGHDRGVLPVRRRQAEEQEEAFGRDDRWQARVGRSSTSSASAAATRLPLSR